MANIYNEPGSSNVIFTLKNNTHEYLLANIGTAKIGLVTDLKKFVYSDLMSNMYKVLTDSSGSENTPSTRLFFADSNGSASSHSDLTFDGLNLKAPRLTITASQGSIRFGQGDTRTTAEITTSDVGTYAEGDFVIKVKGSSDDNPPTEKLRIKSDGNIIGSGASGFDIITNTADGSDTKRIKICGGGAVSNSRGAYIALYGNQHTNTGNIKIIAGNGNGTTTGAVEVSPRMYFGTRPAKDYYDLAIGNHTFWGNSNYLNIIDNAYYDGGWKYRTTRGAARIAIGSNGNINLKVASKGTADSALTWNTALYVNSVGNVAIGHTSPSEKLDILGNVKAQGRLSIVGLKTTSGDVSNQVTVTDDADFAQGVGGGIAFNGKYNSAGTIATFAGIKGVKANSTNANYSGELHFQTRKHGSSPVTHWIIDEDGNLKGDGNINVGGLTASRIVQTDATKRLVSVAKNTAYNKNFGTTSGTVCQGNDSRLSDARTPTAHASTHLAGGSDQVFNQNLNTTDGPTFTGGYYKTNNGSNPLIITRTWASDTKESMQMWVDDSRGHIYRKNDEHSSGLRITIENTDLEHSDGSRANTNYWDFTSSNTGSSLTLTRGANTYTYWHSGNFDPSTKAALSHSHTSTELPSNVVYTDTTQTIRGAKTFSNNVIVGSTSTASNRVVRVLTNDSYNAGFEAYGSNQGTGYLFVGRGSTYGGGIFYNGDGSPSFASGEIADRICFYRMNSSSKSVAFYYPYNSNDVYFNGNLILNSDSNGFKLSQGQLITNGAHYRSVNFAFTGSISGENIQLQTDNGYQRVLANAGLGSGALALGVGNYGNQLVVYSSEIHSNTPLIANSTFNCSGLATFSNDVTMDTLNVYSSTSVNTFTCSGSAVFSSDVTVYGTLGVDTIHSVGGLTIHNVGWGFLRATGGIKHQWYDTVGIAHDRLETTSHGVYLYERGIVRSDNSDSFTVASRDGSTVHLSVTNGETVPNKLNIGSYVRSPFAYINAATTYWNTITQHTSYLIVGGDNNSNITLGTSGVPDGQIVTFARIPLQHTEWYVNGIPLVVGKLYVFQFCAYLGQWLVNQ